MAGKTTTAGKLALHLRKQFNKKPMLVAGDIYRPAAIDQLETVGKQIDVPVFSLGDQVKPQQIVTEGGACEGGTSRYPSSSIQQGVHIDEALMNELAEIKEIAGPDEVMLVVDSMTGQ